MPRTQSGKRARASTRDQEDDSDDHQSDSGSGSGTDYDQAPSAAKGKKKAVAKGKGKAAAPNKGKGKGKKKQQDSDQDMSDDDDAQDDDDDDAPKGKGKKAKLTDEERAELVQAITRHILFTEYTRKLHRKDEISKAVLDKGRARHFNDLIVAVQKNLRTVLGMELVAMRPKEGFKSQSKVYVLRSTIPLPLLRHATNVGIADMAHHGDEQFASSSSLARELANWEEDGEDVPGADDVDDGDAQGGLMRDYKREEGGAYGVLGVILALILVNGKVLGDDQLITYLRRLSLYPSSPIPVSLASAHPQTLTLSSYILLLAKQGYIERGASASGAKGGAVPATQRTTKGSGATLTEGGDPNIEYRWGARAEIELGEVGVASFIQRVFEAKLRTDEDDDDGEDGETAVQKAAKAGKRGKTGEKLLKEIARAAGSATLQDAGEMEISL